MSLPTEVQYFLAPESAANQPQPSSTKVVTDYKSIVLAFAKVKGGKRDDQWSIWSSGRDYCDVQKVFGTVQEIQKLRATRDGAVFWGNTTEGAAVPHLVDLDERWTPANMLRGIESATDISAGEAHTAILIEGSVFVHGRYHLSNGLESPKLKQATEIIIPHVPRGQYISIASTNQSTYAVDQQGVIHHWGDVPVSMFKSCPVNYSVPYEVVQLPNKRRAWRAVGSARNVCFLDDEGQIYALGDNSFGQVDVEFNYLPGLADHQLIHEPTPIASLKGKKIFDVAVGCQHIIVLDTSRNVFAFGRGSEGQLGLGTIQSFGMAKSIEFFRFLREVVGSEALRHAYTIKKVVANRFSSAAITEAGIVYTWGENCDFKLGQGDALRTLPTRVTVDAEVTPVDIVLTDNRLVVVTKPIAPAIDFVALESHESRATVLATQNPPTPQGILLERITASALRPYRLTNGTSAGHWRCLSCGKSNYSVSQCGNCALPFRSLSEMADRMRIHPGAIANLPPAFLPPITVQRFHGKSVSSALAAASETPNYGSLLTRAGKMKTENQ